MPGQGDYKKYVTIENGRNVLYMQLNKALYGCMQSTLLWYETFAGKLKDMGFKLNPYDPCVANKIIDGSQCTIEWYVDDIKVSHVSDKVVTQLLDNIKDSFSNLTIKRGDEHTYVRM